MSRRLCWLLGLLLAGFTTGLTVTILGLGTAQVWWLTLVGLDVLAFAVTAKGHYGTRPSIIAAMRTGDRRETISPPLPPGGSPIVANVLLLPRVRFPLS